MFSTLKKVCRPSYHSVAEMLKRYFRMYGGLQAILKSPYLHSAVVLSLLSFGFWREAAWWATPISVLPNLIGFTLGGYAILVSFGNERFMSVLTEPVEGKPASVFMAVNATFVHFIIVQVSALLLALVAQSRPLSSILSIFPSDLLTWIAQEWPVVSWFRIICVRTFWFFAYTIFLYAVLSTIAGTVAIFWLGGWFERLQNAELNSNKDKSAQRSMPPKL